MKAYNCEASTTDDLSGTMNAKQGFPGLGGVIKWYRRKIAHDLSKCPSDSDRK